MSDVIDFFIYNQKPVMGLRVIVKINPRILSIMPFYIQAELPGNLSVINIHTDAGFALGKLNENGIIDITVDYHDTLIGFPDQTGNEYVCIEYLTIEENALFRFLGFRQSIKNCIYFFIGLQLLHFKAVKSLKQ